MAELPKRIHLKGTGRHDERMANGTIKPGHLIKLDSSNKVVVHATAGGDGERNYALENALEGETIADAYASGDNVEYVIATRGDEIYGYLKGGENVAIGDQLSSGGNGSHRKVTGTDKALAVALEAVNASDSNDVDERIKIRVL